MDKKQFYCEILGVSPDATQEEIKSAYRENAKILHPDRHNNSELAKRKFQQLQVAYEYLTSRSHSEPPPEQSREQETESNIDRDEVRPQRHVRKTKLSEDAQFYLINVAILSIGLGSMSWFKDLKRRESLRQREVARTEAAHTPVVPRNPESTPPAIDTNNNSGVNPMASEGASSARNKQAVFWYANFENNQMMSCTGTNLNLDQTWQELNKGFGPCELNTGPGKMLTGYIFVCGANKMSIPIFRSKKDCELVRKKVNEGAIVASEGFAPSRVESPSRWIFSLDACVNRAATTEALATVKLQKIHDYCVCSSDAISKSEKQDLEDKGKMFEVAFLASKKCLSILGVDVQGDKEKDLRKIVKEKIGDVKKRVFGKNTIKVSEKLHVYDEWFFISSIENYSIDGFVKTNSKTVKPGQGFGFQALFIAEKSKVKVRVELHVPHSAEKYPFHTKTGRVTFSNDHKTVIVEEEVPGSKDSLHYFWGVAEDDPKGKYELKLWLDGKLIKSHPFEVVSLGK